MEEHFEEARYVISIAARIVGVGTQTLRYYERAGLLTPSRSQGKRRLYSQADIERLKRIKRLTEDLGINLAGVEVILRLVNHIIDLENKIQLLESELSLMKKNDTKGNF